MAGVNMDDFKSKIEVYRHLKKQGKYKISRSQFYEHCNDRLLRPDNDGGFTLQAVNSYAKKHLREAATGRHAADKLDKMMEEKLDLELQSARMKVEKEQLDLDAKRGKTINRQDHELAIVSRAVAFMAHLNHAIQANVPDWIELVEGDQNRAAELVHAMSEVVEQRMGDFAADAEFDVILEAN